MARRRPAGPPIAWGWRRPAPELPRQFPAPCTLTSATRRKPRASQRGPKLKSWLGFSTRHSTDPALKGSTLRRRGPPGRAMGSINSARSRAGRPLVLLRWAGHAPARSMAAFALCRSHHPQRIGRRPASRPHLAALAALAAGLPASSAHCLTAPGTPAPHHHAAQEGRRRGGERSLAACSSPLARAAASPLGLVCSAIQCLCLCPGAAQPAALAPLPPAATRRHRCCCAPNAARLLLPRPLLPRPPALSGRRTSPRTSRSRSWWRTRRLA